MEFRTDINALRALAVMAVVFYHFGLMGFGGGFSGVDIFFVISGFLMTGIIVGGLENGRFSLARFYVARIRRIVPALAGLCLALAGLGWFYLSPFDYRELGKHIAGAMTFTSNIMFEDESGYFDSLSKDKIMLHTWSLSVEWQFYLLYPLMLWPLARFAKGDHARMRRYALVLLAVLSVVSLTASAISASVNPGFGFFMLPTRMWEMAAGGLVWISSSRFLPSNFIARSMTWAGLVFMLGGIFFFTSATPWPGLWAVVPVLGAALFVLGGHARHWRIFAKGWIQSIGLWSYSIYLWHWPVYVALRYYQLDRMPLWVAGGVTLSILLGALSYRFIETPARTALTFRKEYIARTVGFCALVVLIAVSGWFIHAKDGFLTRAPGALTALQTAVDTGMSVHKKPILCDKDNLHQHWETCDKADSAPDYILIGDSHAAAFAPALLAAAPDKKGRFYIKSCPPVHDAYVAGRRSVRTACETRMTRITEDIKHIPSNAPILMVFRYSYYLHGYNETDAAYELVYNNTTPQETARASADVFANRLVKTLCTLADTGHPVYTLRPMPEMGVDVARTLARRIMIDGNAAQDVTIPAKTVNARHASVNAALDTAARTCGVRLLDPVPLLCEDGVCYGSRNHTAFYYDDDHLSEVGAMKLKSLAKVVLNQE